MSSFVPLASLRSVTVSSPLILPQFEAAPGDIIHVGILVEALTGAPTAATLVPKWQVSPIECNGVNLNSESDAVSKPWIDVVSTNPGLGQLIADSDWPTNAVDNTYFRTATGSSSVYTSGVPVLLERRLRVGALARQVRVVLTPTFSGGTSPTWVVTATGGIQPHFGY